METSTSSSSSTAPAGLVPAVAAPVAGELLGHAGTQHAEATAAVLQGERKWRPSGKATARSGCLAGLLALRVRRSTSRSKKKTLTMRLARRLQQCVRVQHAIWEATLPPSRSTATAHRKKAESASKRGRCHVEDPFVSKAADSAQTEGETCGTRHDQWCSRSCCAPAEEQKRISSTWLARHAALPARCCKPCRDPIQEHREAWSIVLHAANHQRNWLSASGGSEGKACTILNGGRKVHGGAVGSHVSARPLLAPLQWIPQAAYQQPWALPLASWITSGGVVRGPRT